MDQDDPKVKGHNCLNGLHWWSMLLTIPIFYLLIFKMLVGVEARQGNEVGVGEKGDMHKNVVVGCTNSLIKNYTQLF